MAKPIDQGGARMYLSEVRDLVAGIQMSMERIEALGKEWCAQHQVAEAIGAGPVEEWDPSAHAAALHASMAAQADAFMLFEALLAQWARLSLLFHPILKNKHGSVWRRERGELLRHLVDLPDDSLLANRDARDAWMHFDERLDQSFQEGWLGNRQTFVRSRSAVNTAAYSVRVVDLEALALYYRDKAGAIQSISLAEMRLALAAITRGLDSAGTRVAALPEPTNRGG